MLFLGYRISVVRFFMFFQLEFFSFYVLDDNSKSNKVHISVLDGSTEQSKNPLSWQVIIQTTPSPEQILTCG